LQGEDCYQQNIRVAYTAPVTGRLGQRKHVKEFRHLAFGNAHPYDLYAIIFQQLRPISRVTLITDGFHQLAVLALWAMPFELVQQLFGVLKN